MNCRDFERACQDRLDARLPLASGTDPELAGHASTCAACRPSWERFRVLERSLLAWEPPLGPSRGFADRVLASRDEAAGVLRLDPSVFRSRVVRWAAAAAAIVLVGAIGWRLDRARRDPAGPVEAAPRRHLAARPLADVLSEATASGLALARETSAPAARVGRHVFAAASLTSPAVDAFVPKPSGAGVFQSVGDQVGRGVRPISGTARRAFGFLLGTTPQGTDRAGGGARGA